MQVARLLHETDNNKSVRAATWAAFLAQSNDSRMMHQGLIKFLTCPDTRFIAHRMSTIWLRILVCEAVFTLL